MKKSFVFLSILLAILLSSCSMLNKSSGKEVSVSIDTKPLANYIPLLMNTDDTGAEGSQEAGSGEAAIGDSLIVRVSLSGDFTETLSKEAVVDSEKARRDPETLNFKFENLTFQENAKATVKVDVLLNTAGIDFPFVVSNSLLSAEKEQTLSSGNNSFSLEMNYASPEWPTEGVLSYLPPLDDFWFYTEETFENGKCWTVFTKNDDLDEEKVKDYNDELNKKFRTLYDNTVNAEIVKYYGYSDDCVFKIPEGFNPELSGNKFSVVAFFNKPIEYTITYITEFGELPDDTVSTYTIKDSVELPVLYDENEDHEFIGWYDEKNRKIESWEPGDKTGDLTLIAYWDEAPEIEFSLNFLFTTPDNEKININNPDFLKKNLIALPSDFFDYSKYIMNVVDDEENDIAFYRDDNIISFSEETEIPEDGYTLKISLNGTLTSETVILPGITDVSVVFDWPDSTNTGDIQLPFKESESFPLKNYSIAATGANSISVSNTSVLTWYDSQTVPGKYTAEITFSDTSKNEIKLTPTVYVWPGFKTDWYFGPDTQVTEDHELIITLPDEEVTFEDPKTE